jgi:hypothetical protein
MITFRSSSWLHKIPENGLFNSASGNRWRTTAFPHSDILCSPDIPREWAPCLSVLKSDLTYRKPSEKTLNQCITNRYRCDCLWELQIKSLMNNISLSLSLSHSLSLSCPTRSHYLALRLTQVQSCDKLVMTLDSSLLIRYSWRLGVVLNTCNSSTWEARGLPIPGQPWLHSKTLSQKKIQLFF